MNPALVPDFKDKICYSLSFRFSNIRITINSYVLRTLCCDSLVVYGKKSVFLQGILQNEKT